ncbi:MAG: glycosyl hydrolase family 39 [Bryobacteraceae bacterium]
MSAHRSFTVAVLFGAVFSASSALGQKVSIDWHNVRLISKTTPTLQVVVNPPLRRGSAIHDRAFAELRKLGADYVRYVPWLPYPKLGVAELKPPANGNTSWNFSLIDPMTEDFMSATHGHSVILNFSTSPAWLWKTAKPVTYPKDPNQVDWHYTQGTELRDPSGKQLGDYYARLVSWYVNGGFTDKYGKRHESGHHYKIPYWEVLNEVDFEHNMTPEQYTARYDAIVSAIKRVDSSMKFVALALASPRNEPRMFEYFLNHKNHKPGTPINFISYHFYASPTPDQSPDVQQYTFFDQAAGFLDTVRYIDRIRKRLSPHTRTDIDEIGSIAANDNNPNETPDHLAKRLPDSYWSLSGALYAYIFGNLDELGIDVAGESQLVGYPSQFPSVTMVNWKTGAPNARFRVLQLIKDNFGPGDKIVKASSGTPYVYVLAVINRRGEHKLLLVNKRNRDIRLTLPRRAKRIEFVDVTTKGAPPQTKRVQDNTIALHGFEVAAVTLR